MSRVPTRSLLRTVFIVFLIVIAAALVLSHILRPADSSAFRSYDAELAQIRSKIQQLDSADPKYAYQHVKLAQLTGDFTDFYKADALLGKFSQDRELVLLNAKIALSMHDVARGETIQNALKERLSDARTDELALDIALQKGQYEQAIELLRERLHPDADWPDLARYAYLVHKFGDSVAADNLLVIAQERLSTKQIQDYAWLELQRGIIDLEDEKYSDARAHFELANQIFPGHWLIEEHLAETYGLLNEPQKAIALYEGVIKKSSDPMYSMALADLIEATQPERAMHLRRGAEASFNERFEYYPLAASGHLIDAWIEAEQTQHDPQRRERLLTLSELNLKHRPNADSQIQRIKVLSLTGQSDEARQLTEKLLATPWRTADVFYLAKQSGLQVPQQRIELMPANIMKPELAGIR